MSFTDSQDLTGSGWVLIVKNTFVDILDPAEPRNRRQLKQSLTCGDVPEPTFLTSLSGVEAQTTAGTRWDEPAVSEKSSFAPDLDLPLEHEEIHVQPGQPAAKTQHSDLIPIVRNTFVEVFDLSEQLCKRQLKPFRTCGDIPDPITGTASCGLDVSTALRGRACTDVTAVAARSIDHQPCVAVGATCQAAQIASAESLPCREEVEPEHPSYTGSACGSLSEQSFQAGPKRNRSESNVSSCTLRPKVAEPMRPPGAEIMHCQKDSSIQSASEGKAAEADSGSKYHPWVIDARKLRGSDRQLVSPPFSVSLGAQTAMFRLILVPASLTDPKSSGLNFQKTSGWGIVQVKCEAVLPEAHGRMTYRFWVGAGERLQRPRGPICHNFAETAVSSLPKGEDLWDFNVAVDPASSSFTIWLEQISAISLSDALGTPSKANSRNFDKFDMTVTSPTTSQGWPSTTPQNVSMAPTKRLPCATPQRKQLRPFGVPGRFVEMLASVVDANESSSSSEDDN